MFRFLGALCLCISSASPTFAQSCDKNCQWACVPVAKDVDCAGGSGNSPKYVRGPVKIVGRDLYRLDRDHDGYGCEPKGWKPSQGNPNF